MSNRDLTIIILAAGMGKRMNSKKQKILHAVGGRPMLMHVVHAARSVTTQPPAIVIGPIGGDAVRELVGDDAVYVVQAEQLGTGHATRVTSDHLRARGGQVIVTYGDMPLIKSDTLAQLADIQSQSGAAVVLTTAVGEPSSSFGRIVRDDAGRVIEIVEVAEARRRDNTEALLDIRELNVGIYCFDAEFLWRYLPDLPLRQARSGVEYYLTDMIELAVKAGLSVEAVPISEPDECLGAGTRAELVAVERAFQQRTNRHWLNHGVTLVDPDSIYIDPEVTIGRDSIIWPNTFLQGRTTIGEDCVIGPNITLRDRVVADGTQIDQLSA